MTGLSQKSGMVLLLTVILLGLVSALVMESQLEAGVSVRHAEAAATGARLRLAAMDAVFEACRRLADDEMLEADYLDEPWAKTREITTPDGIALRVDIEDENRRFDMNNIYTESVPSGARSPLDILMDAMTICGDFTPVGRVSALEDWVDPDDAGGRETAFYKEKDPPYTAANRWLASWDEVLLVDGFSRDYLEHRANLAGSDFRGRLLDLVTLVPGRRTAPRTVNVNTASRDVLRAVSGLGNDEWVNYVMFMRAEGPIVSLDALIQAGMAERIRPILPYLGTASDTFSVMSRAFADGVGKTVTAEVQRNAQGNVKIIRWIE